jgi:hypothetical protein
LAASLAAEPQRQPTLAQAARDHRRQVEHPPAIAAAAVRVQFVRSRMQAGDRSKVDHDRASLRHGRAHGVRLAPRASVSGRRVSNDSPMKKAASMRAAFH